MYYFFFFSSRRRHTRYWRDWSSDVCSSDHDYMKEGVYDALDAIERATGEKGVNAIGYCLGGTLLATTLAHMAAKGDDRIKAATYFVTMSDFSEAGDRKSVV